MASIVKQVIVDRDGMLRNHQRAARARASWTAATERSVVAAFDAAGCARRCRRLARCGSQSGDFADSVTAVQNLAAVHRSAGLRPGAFGDIEGFAPGRRPALHFMEKAFVA